MSIIQAPPRVTLPDFVFAPDQSRELHKSQPTKPITLATEAHDRFKESDRSNYHEFPHAIAQAYDVSEAIVLKYLSFCISSRPHSKEGKEWTRKSLEQLSQRFPYLKRSTLAAIVKRMQSQGLIEVGKFNRWKHDRTQWFHVPDNHMTACKGKKLIRFNVHVASKFGIPAAIIYHNLIHWIREHCKDDDQKLPVHSMSPAGLHEALPFFSLNTIKRALDQLTKEAVIIKTSKTKPLYTLPDNHPVMIEFLGNDEF